MWPQIVPVANILNSRKILSLQVLRAFGALAVVLFHSAQATTKYSPFVARSLEYMKYASFRVDLFFVLSGFFTCYTVSNQSASNFLRRRVERLAPTYWICTILVALASVVFTLSAGQFSWIKLLTSMAFVSLPAGDFPLVSQGWTLEYEMFFNCCVTAALFLTPRVWPLVVGILASSIIAGALISPETHLEAFLSAPIMLEFLMGILIAQWFKSGRVVSWELAFVLAAVAVVYLSPTATHRPIYAGLPSALIVLLAIFARSITPPKWLLALGDASYSIYLVQIFTIPGCAKAVHALLPNFDPDMLMLVATTMSVIVGLGFYSHVELRIQRWLKGSRSSSSNSTAVVLNR